MQKTAVITGASRGIGRATALAFARTGEYRVAFSYHTHLQDALELERFLTENLRCDAAAFPADVSDPGQISALFDAVENRFGSVDVLVNNAGFAQQKLFQDLTPEDWDQMFRVHLGGTVSGIRRALPAMLRKQQGSIVNVSSMWGITGASCETHYSAVKAALIGLTKALAKELGPSGIRVNAVAPGVISTDMCRFSDDVLGELKDQTPLGRLGRPEDVAESILFLAGEASSFVTGQVLSPNGGMVL